MILFVQSIHTLIIISLYFFLIYSIYCHLMNIKNHLLIISYWAISIEGILLIYFGLKCPLSIVLRNTWGKEFPTSLIPGYISGYLLEFGYLLFALLLLTKIWNVYCRYIRT